MVIDSNSRAMDMVIKLQQLDATQYDSGNFGSEVYLSSSKFPSLLLSYSVVASITYTSKH
jgi:hypothetical protein